MRPKLALTVSASRSDNVCFFVNTYASCSSEQLPYSYYKAPHTTQPPIARTETLAAASIIAAKPTPPQSLTQRLISSNLRNRGVVALWLPPTISSVSPCRLLEGRKKESDRSRSCPYPQRDLLIAFRGAARLCQGASPQEGKQLRRVRLQHPCALKVSGSAPRLSYNAPLVPQSSST